VLTAGVAGGHVQTSAAAAVFAPAVVEARLSERKSGTGGTVANENGGKRQVDVAGMLSGKSIMAGPVSALVAGNQPLLEERYDCGAMLHSEYVHSG